MSCVAKKSAHKFGLSEHGDKSRRSGNPARLKVQSVSQMSFERSVKFHVILFITPFITINGRRIPHCGTETVIIRPCCSDLVVKNPFSFM